MPSRVVGSAKQSIQRQDQAVRAEFAVGLENIGIDLEAQQREVVQRWVHKPKFRRVLTVGRDFMVLRVPASGQHAKIWNWVNYGTEGPYPILAKNGGKLTFQTGYQPKTAAVAKVNANGGKANGAWVTTDMVWHPGIEAREFTRKLAEAILPFLLRELCEAVRRGLRRR